jgi:hypothetical protein
VRRSRGAEARYLGVGDSKRTKHSLGHELCCSLFELALEGLEVPTCKREPHNKADLRVWYAGWYSGVCQMLNEAVTQ